MQWQGEFSGKKCNLLQMREQQHQPPIRAAAVYVTYAAQAWSQSHAGSSSKTSSAQQSGMVKNVTRMTAIVRWNTEQKKSFCQCINSCCNIFLNIASSPNVPLSERILENWKIYKDKFKVSELWVASIGAATNRIGKDIRILAWRRDHWGSSDTGS